MSGRAYIKNPKTGKDILVGGPTYEKLKKSSKYGPMLNKAQKFKKDDASKSRGCSNAGKYKNVPASEFCGPAGGSCPGTYPVNTRQRARAALSYARYAPNPEGIKKCVRDKSKKKGWVNPKTGRLMMQK